MEGNQFHGFHGEQLAVVDENNMQMSDDCFHTFYNKDYGFGNSDIKFGMIKEEGNVNDESMGIEEEGFTSNFGQIDEQDNQGFKFKSSDD